jgi:hypothetical protein
MISAEEMRARREGNGHDAEWPLLIDITTGPGAVPPFPVDLLPPPFSTFVADVSDRMQTPADFVAIPLIVSAATMLGHEVRIKPKRHDDWTERPCLWGMVVSLSSTGKTPAMDEAMRVLNKINRELWDVYNAALAAWKKDRGEEEDKPQREAVVVSDPTVERLGQLMANSRGMMLYRDELSGWLQGMNKYRKGGGDDRQAYLQFNSGGSMSIERMSREDLFIPDAYLSIFGGIQPDVACKVFRGGDADGMTARFMLAVWPDETGDRAFVDRRPDFEARYGVERRLRDMRSVSRDEPIRFDGLAYSLFSRWYLRNINRHEEGAFRVHGGKYPALFARLAVTMHFMRYGSEAPEEIGIETAQAVERLIDGYLEPHAKKMYGAITAHPALPGAVKIAKWLRDKPVEKFTARDVRRKNWAEFARERDEDAIGAALKLLDAYGWIRLDEKSSGAKGGRPTMIAIVNPLVSAA